VTLWQEGTVAILRLQFFGDAIAKQTNMTVILPEDVGSDGPFPVYYLLHGLSDDDSIWLRRTSVERYVSGMPLIVVMPDSGRGFYTDAVSGPAYERHIMEDVVGFVDRFFPTIASREGRVIGGLSMGGYGSMKLALKHPDRFCSVVSHSSAFDIRKRLADKDRGPEFSRIFGDDPEKAHNDVFSLAQAIDPDLLPAIRFDCGTEDGLLQENRDFHAHLDSIGVEHEYEEFPGGHEWGYWDLRVQEALAFHARALRLAVKPD
jgi:putative tributyrin esterase